MADEFKMIDIIDKKDCVGCNACVQRCPKSCISMHEDEQGFVYPVVDTNLSIDCHLCENVCPVINHTEPKLPIETYAAKNPDDKVRLSSSSGGIFYALAKMIIDDGGVVFGAKFNENWEVVHDYAETLEEVKAFQGSKYVQSQIGETFIQAETFLKAGRRVMFSGTPCQIKALGLFLRKDYGDKLLKVDVVCHGVPSPLVWKEYLKYITRPKGASDGKNTVFVSLKEQPVLTGISFRDKRLRWEKFGFSVRVAASKASGKNSVFQSVDVKSKDRELFFETLDKNLFMSIFLNNLCLRPSCFECPAKSGCAGSDISLADYWGIWRIDRRLYDPKGVSLVLANTEHGVHALETIGIDLHATEYAEALRYNPTIEHNPKENVSTAVFWQQFAEGGFPAIVNLAKAQLPSLLTRIIGGLKSIVRRIL